MSYMLNDDKVFICNFLYKVKNEKRAIHFKLGTIKYFPQESYENLHFICMP